MENPADIWDQVVSQSIKRLSTRTPVAEQLKKIEVTNSPQKIHQPSRDREPGLIQPELRKVIREAAFAGLRWPLFITGKPGTGKTCAGLCVADYVRGSNWWAWDDFWRFIGDVNFGRATEMRGGAWNQEGYREVSTSVTWTPKSFWASFGNLSLAVIDDVGLRAIANDTQYEAMKMALDRREKCPLIVTSNLDLPGIGEIFDLRIMDRLASGTVVELTGESRR